MVLIIDLADILLLPVLRNELHPPGAMESPNVMSRISNTRVITKQKNSKFIIYFSIYNKYTKL